MKKPKLINASNYMVTAEQANKTRFIQDKSSGRMRGRTIKTRNPDMTRNIRFTKDVELDGKPGIGRRDIKKGQIGGRLKEGESKPSKIEVTNHYRNGKFVGHHIRKIH